MCLSVLRIVDASTVQQITFKGPTNCHFFTNQSEKTIIDLINVVNYITSLLIYYINSLSFSLKEEVMLAEENKNSGRSALDGMNFILIVQIHVLLKCMPFM